MRRSLSLIVVLLGVSLAASVAMSQSAQGRPGSIARQEPASRSSAVDAAPWSVARRNVVGLQEETDAYPPPPLVTATPIDPAEWVYASASLQEIAASTLARLVALEWATSTTRVLHVRNYGPQEAVLLGDEPDAVLHGSPVDVAVTLEGEILTWMPGYGAPTTYPYAVVIVDRATGSPYGVGYYDSLEDIPELFR